MRHCDRYPQGNFKFSYRSSANQGEVVQDSEPLHPPVCGCVGKCCLPHKDVSFSHLRH